MGIWDGIGMGIVGGLVGEATKTYRLNQQTEAQKKLMAYQRFNQERLNRQGADLQYEMWQKTNYPAQMKMLEEAGLNPALLYGQGGAGGTTAGSQGGGSASGGQATQPNPMDVAQLALLSAQARKLNVESDNIEKDTEVKDEQKNKLYQEGKQTFLDNIIKKYGMWGDDGTLKIIKSEHYGQAGFDENSPLAREIKFNPNLLEQQLNNLKVEERAKEAGIELTKEQARKIYHEIIQEWIKTGIKSLDLIPLIKNATK